MTLSDREDNPRLLGYLKETCELNGLTNVKIIGLTWGVVSPNLININEYDYILASDCFYDSKGTYIIVNIVVFLLTLSIPLISRFFSLAFVPHLKFIPDLSSSSLSYYSHTHTLTLTLRAWCVWVCVNATYKDNRCYNETQESYMNAHM